MSRPNQRVCLLRQIDRTSDFPIGGPSRQVAIEAFFWAARESKPHEARDYSEDVLLLHNILKSDTGDQ